jgi:hypothetical protein
MNLIKKFVTGLGNQTAPFGFAPEDPEAGYKAGLGYIGDIGANLMANNQGGVDPFANLGASLQQAKASGTQRNKEQYTAQRLMEEAALKRQEREKAAAEEAQREEFLKSLPPDVQMKARSVPGFLEAYVQATDPNLQKPEQPKLYTVDGALVDANGNVVYQGQGGGGSGVKWKTVTLNDGVYAVDESDPTNMMKLGDNKQGDTRASATELKELWASEDELPILDNTIESLQRARDLNKKTFTGWTAGTRGWVGTAIPGAENVGIDPEAAKATREFGQIMSLEAIKNMAETLKGATTNEELARFVEILADPSTPPDIRERTIDRMISLAEKVRTNKFNRVQELSGTRGRNAAPVVTEDGITIEQVGD